MSFFSNKNLKTAFDGAENLGNSPNGGRLKMWLCGVALAAVPVGYGIHALWNGKTRMYGSRRDFLDLSGSGGTALAIAYLAVGAFIHFHYFWGLHLRLHKFSPLLKFLAVLIFLPAFGYAIVKSLE